MNKNIEISGIKFINRIDDTLKDQNKTRKYLCEKLNILQGTMATWKTKDIMPPVDTIQRIANELEVSTQWLIDGDINFEENTNFLGAQSRKSIRERIYIALKNKYENKDNRFTDDYLSNSMLLRELHNYYFAGDFVSFDYLYNWSKGRCEIEFFKFNQLAIGLNTSLPLSNCHVSSNFVRPEPMISKPPVLRYSSIIAASNSAYLPSTKPLGPPRNP